MCDFEGWATYYNIKCIDGSIIKTGSFEKCDKLKIPLLLNLENLHNLENVIGYLILESRNEGVYSYGYLNTKGEIYKILIKNKEIKYICIYANEIKTIKNTSQDDDFKRFVTYGTIRAASLESLSSNPKSLITKINF